MTLEQFADLMTGLGYKAEKGERVKVKASAAPKPDAAKASGSDDAVVDVVVEPAAADETAATAESIEAPETDDVAAEHVVETTAEPVADTAAEEKAESAPDMEQFVTFTWGRSNQGGGQRGQRRGQNADADGGAGRGGKPQGKGRGGKPQGKGGPGKGAPGKKGGRPQQGAKSFSARPPKPEKKIDPDNPFAAALMGMKQGK